MPVLPAVPSTTTDTPERRAALRKRVMEAADRIRDTVVREYYVNEFRGRLFELFAPPARARGEGWRRDGRPERRPGPGPRPDGRRAGKEGAGRGEVRGAAE